MSIKLNQSYIAEDSNVEENVTEARSECVCKHLELDFFHPKPIRSLGV